MTGAEFVAIAHEMYGAHWLEKIALQLDMSTRTIYRLRKVAKVPQYIAYAILFLREIHWGRIIYKG